MPLNIELVPLRFRPDLCAFFAGRFEAEWPAWYGPGKADASADLRDFANERGELPVGVIALDVTGRAVGIAALKAASIPSHEHLCPWATAGYVLPSHRRQGIGAALLRALLVEAGRLGFHSVFCATATAATLLERERWRQIDAVLHDGQALRVFEHAAARPDEGAHRSKEA